MHIAILTSGGDSPGMNTFLINFSNILKKNSIKHSLIKNGYKGLRNFLCFDEDIGNKLYSYEHYGGTIIGTSRLPELKDENIQKEIANTLKKNNVSHLIVLGGNGSFKGAYKLSKLGINVFCLPGTIDNDVEASEMSLGFYSALQANVETINQSIRCAISHSRFYVFQTMGGYASQLAIDSGLITGADYIATHEKKWDIDEIAKIVKESVEKNGFGFMTIPDLMVDPYKFAKELEEKSGVEIRAEVISRIQRGAKPNVFDSLLAIKMSSFLYEKIKEGKKNSLIVYKDGKVIDVPINSALKDLSPERAIKELELYKKVRW